MFATYKWMGCFALCALSAMPGLVWAQADKEKAPEAKAAEAKPSSAEAISAYADAANLQNAGEFKTASEEWEKFLKKHADDPLAPKAQLYLGVCHMQAQTFDKAAAAFQALLTKHPVGDWREDALLNLGWCQYTQAKAGKKELYEFAAKNFDSLAKEFATGRYADQALYFQGESLYQQDKKPDSVPLYAALVEKFPQSKLRADGLYALGVTREELGLFAEAGPAYDLFLKEFPEHAYATEVKMRKAETVLQAGVAAETGGKPDDAKKLFVQAETLFGEAAAVKDFSSADHAIYRQALAAWKQGKPAIAGELYAKIPEAYPKSPYIAEVTAAAGRCFYIAEKFPEAAQWLEKSVKAGGNDGVEAAHWLARIHLKNKEAAKAAEVASAAVAKAEKDHPFLVNLKLDQADALFEIADKKAEALKLFEAIATEHAQHELAPQALYNAAFAAQELKQYPQAQALCERFLKTWPKDKLVADVQNIQAESGLVSSNYAEAEKTYRGLLAATPDHPEADQWKLRLGLALQLQKKYKEVIDLLGKVAGAMKTPERTAEAHFLVGSAHFYQDQFPEAAAALAASTQASNKWRQADEALLMLSRSQRKQNKVDEALATMHKVLADYPETKLADQVQYRMGEALYAKDDMAGAIAAYDVSATKWPDAIYAPYALYGKGWCQLREKKYADAIASLTQMLEKHPKHDLVGDARFARAMSYRNDQKFAEAAADLEECLKLKLDPQRKGDVLYERALCESAEKKYDAVVKTITELLAAEPPYTGADKALYELAWAQKSLGKGPEALAEFEKLAKNHAASPLAGEASYHIGEAQYEKKDYEQAVKWYAAAQQKAGKTALGEKSTYKLAWCHYQLQQYEPALQQFSDQLKNFAEGPLAADAQFMQGECLFRQKKWSEALAAFQAAQKLKASSPNVETLILLHGAQSAGNLKQWDEALKLLKDIPTKFPDTPYLAEVLYELGWTKQNLNQLDEALADYEAAAAKSRGEIGARARFMLGEVLFLKKDHEGAAKEFVKLMFGFGGEAAPPEIKRWQAKAGYEAGRCLEVQAGAATDAAAKAPLVAAARKHYGYVVEKHPQDELVGQAKKQLDVLAKLN